MPTVDEVLPKFAKAKVFTVLDAKDGFYQVNKLTRKAHFLPHSGPLLEDIAICECLKESAVHQKSISVVRMKH